MEPRRAPATSDGQGEYVHGQKDWGYRAGRYERFVNRWSGRTGSKPCGFCALNGGLVERSL